MFKEELISRSNVANLGLGVRFDSSARNEFGTLTSKKKSWFFLPESDPMIFDKPPNDERKISFCKKYLRVDRRKVSSCFGDGGYLFVTWDSPMTRDSDKGYGGGR